MSDKPQLFLHVGMAKSGTSALQRFFSDNSRQLQVQGIIYPKTGRYNDDSHHNIPFSLVKNPHKEMLPKAGQVALLDELREEAKGYPRVLLSSENFLLIIEHRLFREFIAEFDLTTIFYLRRQDLFLESHYKQLVADPSLTEEYAPIDKHIKRMYKALTYVPLMDPWTKMGSLIVRPYDRKLFVGENIYSDFCHATDINLTDAFEYPEGDINPTNSNEFVEFMRLLKKCKLLDPLLQLVPMSELTEIAYEILPQDQGTSFLSPEVRSDILAKFDPVNQEIAQTYLDREALFSPALEEQSYSGYDGLSGSEVFRILSEIADRAGVDNIALDGWHYIDGSSAESVVAQFGTLVKGDSPSAESGGFGSLLKKFFARASARKDRK